MAEIIATLGTIATIIQITDFAAKSSLEFYDFLSTIKNAPREIASITREIQSFNGLVCNLKTSLSSPAVQQIINQDAEISHSLRALELPMENCCEAFKSLMEKMRPHMREEKCEEIANLPTPGDVNGMEKSAKGLRQNRSINSGGMKWYFKRREVYSLIGQLERAKVTFADAMGSVTLLLTLKATALPNDIKDDDESKTLVDYGDEENIIAPEVVFDNDAGTALRRFAETASMSKFSMKACNQSLENKMNSPSHTRSNALTRLLITSVKEGSLADTRDALKVTHVDNQDADGRTALSFAAELGQLEIARLLINAHASVSIRQYTNKREGQDFLRVGGRTPLHWAAARGRPAMVRLLLQHGANPNARSTAGRSPLQEAAIQNSVPVIQVLLDHGADVNARSYNHGWTPMHEAGLYGYKEVAQLLSENGAWIDPLSESNLKTPLHCATVGKRFVTMQLLLEWGSNPNAQMYRDTMPLHIAAAGGWVVGIQMLLASGALINARDALLFDTPLHKAARNLHINAIHELCKHGANEEARNIDGQTYREVLACAQAAPDVWQIPVDDPSAYR